MSVALILAAKGSEVIVTEPHRTLADTAALLSARNIGAAVVVNGQCGVVGIISERDIVRAIGIGGAKVLSEAVAEHMSAPVVTTQEDEHIHVAMEVMTRHRHRHLPVMDGGKLV